MQIEKQKTEIIAKLTEELAMLRGIINGTHYAIIATNPEGIITTFNFAAEKLLGYSSEEVVEKHTPEIFHDKKEMEEKAIEIFKQYHEKVTGFQVFIAFQNKALHDTSEWTYICKNGTRIPVLLSVTPIKNSKNELIGFVGIVQDIGERKQIEQLKSELVAITGFELREPIAAIKGVFDLLSLTKDSIPEKTQYVLEIGKRNCLHLINIINDLFEMQKIETGDLIFAFEEIELSSLLIMMVHNFLFIAEQAHVNLIYQPNLEPCKISADRVQFIRMLEHLISDSIRRSPKNGIIKITAQKIDSKIRIEIIDQSSLTPSQFYSQIFQNAEIPPSIFNFSKISNYLMLRIAKSVIGKHNGTLGFETTVEGAVFWIELPLIGT